MTSKEKIQCLLSIYTRVVTGVFLFICLYLFWLPGDASIRLKDILGIHAIGLISAVAYIPLLTDRELSKKMMLLLNFLYFLCINVSVMAFGYTFRWFVMENVITVMAVEACVITVYAVVMVVSYTVDRTQATRINNVLKERNRD